MVNNVERLRTLSSFAAFKQVGQEAAVLRFGSQSLKGLFLFLLTFLIKGLSSELLLHYVEFRVKQ